MLSALDETGLRVEADILFLCAKHGVLQGAEDRELWELAAACGLHFTETLQNHNIREIDAEQKVYYQETEEKRQAILERQAERRRERRARR